MITRVVTDTPLKLMHACIIRHLVLRQTALVALRIHMYRVRLADLSRFASLSAIISSYSRDQHGVRQTNDDLAMATPAFVETLLMPWH